MKKKIIKIFRYFSIALIIFGICFSLYPQFNKLTYSVKSKKIINEYTLDIDKLKKDSENNNTADSNYNKLLKAIKKYNKNLTLQKQKKQLRDTSYSTSAIDLKKYGIDTNIYGYIEIKAINVYMPIYLGANNENLSKGTGHLNYTSLPFGGIGTNAVISGHCGYSGIDMFRYLTNLEVDDKVKITTPFSTLTYTVTATEIIKPTDIEKLYIQKNKDMVTLITCYPYPTNKYRFVVYCDRVN